MDLGIANQGPKNMTRIWVGIGVGAAFLLVLIATLIGLKVGGVIFAAPKVPIKTDQTSSLPQQSSTLVDFKNEINTLSLDTGLSNKSDNLINGLADLTEESEEFKLLANKVGSDEKARVVISSARVQRGIQKNAQVNAEDLARATKGDIIKLDNQIVNNLIVVDKDKNALTKEQKEEIIKKSEESETNIDNERSANVNNGNKPAGPEGGKPTDLDNKPIENVGDEKKYPAITAQTKKSSQLIDPKSTDLDALLIELRAAKKEGITGEKMGLAGAEAQAADKLLAQLDNVHLARELSKKSAVTEPRYRSALDALKDNGLLTEDIFNELVKKIKLKNAAEDEALRAKLPELLKAAAPIIFKDNSALINELAGIEDKDVANIKTFLSNNDVKNNLSDLKIVAKMIKSTEKTDWNQQAYKSLNTLLKSNLINQSEYDRIKTERPLTLSPEEEKYIKERDEVLQSLVDFIKTERPTSPDDQKLAIQCIKFDAIIKKAPKDLPPHPISFDKNSCLANVSKYIFEIEFEPLKSKVVEAIMDTSKSTENLIPPTTMELFKYLRSQVAPLNYECLDIIKNYKVDLENKLGKADSPDYFVPSEQDVSIALERSKRLIPLEVLTYGVNFEQLVNVLTILKKGLASFGTSSPENQAILQEKTRDAAMAAIPAADKATKDKQVELIWDCVEDLKYVLKDEMISKHTVVPKLNWYKELKVFLEGLKKSSSDAFYVIQNHSIKGLDLGTTEKGLQPSSNATSTDGPKDNCFQPSSIAMSTEGPKELKSEIDNLIKANKQPNEFTKEIDDFVELQIKALELELQKINRKTDIMNGIEPAKPVSTGSTVSTIIITVDELKKMFTQIGQMGITNCGLTLFNNNVLPKADKFHANFAGIVQYITSESKQSAAKKTDFLAYIKAVDNLIASWEGWQKIDEDIKSKLPPIPNLVIRDAVKYAELRDACSKKDPAICQPIFDGISKFDDEIKAIAPYSSEFNSLLKKNLTTMLISDVKGELEKMKADYNSAAGTNSASPTESGALVGAGTDAAKATIKKYWQLKNKLKALETKIDTEFRKIETSDENALLQSSYFPKYAYLKPTDENHAKVGELVQLNFEQALIYYDASNKRANFKAELLNAINLRNAWDFHVKRAQELETPKTDGTHQLNLFIYSQGAKTEVPQLLDPTVAADDPNGAAGLKDAAEIFYIQEQLNDTALKSFKKKDKELELNLDAQLQTKLGTVAYWTSSLAESIKNLGDSIKDDAEIPSKVKAKLEEEFKSKFDSDAVQKHLKFTLKNLVTADLVKAYNAL